MMEKLCDDYQKRCLDLEENLKEIRDRISGAAVRSGRNPEEVMLLAATKTVPVEVINHAISLGVAHIGENKVQELCDKYEHLQECDCQFIGHLQTNKVKFLIDKVSMIQSVGSLKLAQEISRLSEKQNKVMDILIEVNIGKEESKSGILPEEVFQFMEQISPLTGIHVRGLMSIPPICDSKTQVMGYFTNMYQYFIDIRGKKIDNIDMDYLSMGMSSDFEEAILCGANIVRVGTSLFGPRLYSKK